MLGLFSKKQPQCPIDEHSRLWMEHAFMWLVQQFGEEKIKNRQVILPTPEFFPIVYDGSNESLHQTAAIIARQMDIDLNEVNLHIYKQGIREMPGAFGYAIFPEGDNSNPPAAGLFFSKTDVHDKYDVFIDDTYLQYPEKMVAILSHEFGHIKLLGEKRIDHNDEHLTDLTTVLFGMGIFNTNAAFEFFKHFGGWGYMALGYFKPLEWTYALGLYAFFRGEPAPAWAKYLSSTNQKDLQRCLAFIHANSSLIFETEYIPEDSFKTDAAYSGKWVGQYTYGDSYTKKAGVSVPFKIYMTVTAGIMQGTSFDDEFKKISDMSANIEGTIKANIITFKLTYPFSWKTNKDGELMPLYDRPSHKVLYSGEFINNQFSGTWIIRSLRRDKDGVYNDYINWGTWSMRKISS